MAKYYKQHTKRVLSFALKESTNGLNTPDNLVRWGIRKFNKCELCGNKSDLMHILNWCKVAFDEGRFTWRHNSVLSHMLLKMKKSSGDDITIYADIIDHKFNGSTIPPGIISTKFRPDLVIINRKAKTIELLELTCSFETNIEQANNKKFRKFLTLKSDLESEDWSVHLTPFEIGSRGHVKNPN